MFTQLLTRVSYVLFIAIALLVIPVLAAKPGLGSSYPRGILP